jgi:hypothetical protein
VVLLRGLPLDILARPSDIFQADEAPVVGAVCSPGGHNIFVGELRGRLQKMCGGTSIERASGIVGIHLHGDNFSVFKMRRLPVIMDVEYESFSEGTQSEEEADPHVERVRRRRPRVYPWDIRCAMNYPAGTGCTCVALFLFVFSVAVVLVVLGIVFGRPVFS